MISQEVDAIYFAYRKPKISEKVINDFMNSYPDANISLIIDFGGHEFNFIHALKSTDVYRSNQRISALQNGLYISRKTLRPYLEYLMLACQKNPSKKWLFVLEDDVKVFYPPTKLLYDLNGVNKNERLHIKIRIMLKILGHRVSKDNRVGGFGGSIFSKSIVSIYSVQEWENKLKIFFKIMKRPLGSDEVISIINTIAGGSIGHYDGLCEVWYEDCQDQLNKNSVSTLHKYLGYADDKE